MKVHVHTDEPGLVLSLGHGRGSVDGIEIANMHEQARARERRLTVIEGGPASDRAGAPRPARRSCWTPPPTCPTRDASPALAVGAADRQLRRSRLRRRRRHRRRRVLRLLRQSSPHHPQTSAPSPACLSGRVRAAGGLHAGCSCCRSRPGSRPRTRSALRCGPGRPRVTVLDGGTVSAGTVLLAEGRPATARARARPRRRSRPGSPRARDSDAAADRASPRSSTSSAAGGSVAYPAAGSAMRWGSRPCSRCATVRW